MAPSIWQILIVLAIVLLIFGTKKLRNMGGDLGGAIRGFKDAMRDGEAEKQEQKTEIEHKSSVAPQQPAETRDRHQS